MAEASWPTAGHNNRAVTDTEYESLVGRYAGEGVVGSPADFSVIYANNGGLKVFARANKPVLLRGHLWTAGPVDVVLDVAKNTSGSDRWDLVVVGLDRATWNVTAYVKSGAGASRGGLRRDMGTTGVFEVPLARILNRNGADNIAPNDIEVLEYYVAPLPTVTRNERVNWAPQELGNEIIDQDGRHWIKKNGAWRSVLADDFVDQVGMKMVASWVPSSGGDQYWSGNGVGAFGSVWFTAIPGHVYQASLDIKMQTGENIINTPLEAVFDIFVGGQKVSNSGTQKLINKREVKKMHFSSPVYWLNGPTQAYIQAFKNYGDGHFTVPGYDTWFRIYDLGPM